MSVPRTRPTTFAVSIESEQAGTAGKMTACRITLPSFADATRFAKLPPSHFTLAVAGMIRTHHFILGL